MPSAISLASSSIASLTGISSASVTSTAAVRAGSAEQLLDRARVAGQRALGHGVDDHPRHAQHRDRVARRRHVEHHGVPHRLAALLLGRVEPRLAEQRVVVEARGSRAGTPGSPGSRTPSRRPTSSAGSSGRTRRARSPASALTAHRFGASWLGSVPTGGLIEVATEAIVRVGLVEQRLACPRARSWPAIAAATVLRPTPPLPTTRISRRSSERARPIARASPSPERALGAGAGGVGSSTTTATPLASALRQPSSLRSVQMPSSGVMSTLMFDDLVGAERLRRREEHAVDHVVEIDVAGDRDEQEVGARDLGVDTAIGRSPGPTYRFSGWTRTVVTDEHATRDNGHGRQREPSQARTCAHANTRLLCPQTDARMLSDPWCGG